MSLRDHVEKLTLFLERGNAELVVLASEMKELRRSFASLRGAALQEGADKMREIAESARARDAEREKIAAELQQALRLDEPFCVSRLLPHLPPDLARRLDTARKAIKESAIELRTEAAVGQRLLEFAASAQEALMCRLLKLQEVETRGYDRQARVTTSAPASGRLVKGVL